MIPASKNSHQRTLRAAAATLLVLPLTVPAQAIYVDIGMNPRAQIEFSRVQLDLPWPGGEAWTDGVNIGGNFPAAAGNVLLGAGRDHFDVIYNGGDVFYTNNRALFNNWTVDTDLRTGANLLPPRPNAKARSVVYIAATPLGGGFVQQSGFKAIDDVVGDNTATVNVTAFDTAWANAPAFNVWFQTGSACWWRGFVPDGADLQFGLRAKGTGFNGVNLNMPDIVFAVDGVNGIVQTPGGPVALLGGDGDDFVKIGNVVAVVAAAGDGGNAVSAEINAVGVRAKLTVRPARQNGQNGWSFEVWAVGLGDMMPPAANPAVQRALVQVVYTIIADPGAEIETADDILPPDVGLPDLGGPDPVLAATCALGKGDVNCDGQVDFFDIDPFLSALFDFASYTATYCNGSLCGVDMNCDGAIDFFDIDPFMAKLFTGSGPCE